MPIHETSLVPFVVSMMKSRCYRMLARSADCNWDFGTHRRQLNCENILIMAADEEAKYDRYWPLADMPPRAANVRFRGYSRHTFNAQGCQLLTQSGHHVASPQFPMC
jgi:hypothetical protein